MALNKIKKWFWIWIRYFSSDKPFPPRNLTAIETSSDYIVIRWEAPESDGGSPVTGYVVEKRDAKRPGFIFIADVAADTFTYKAIRLFEGYEYYFRVIAENIVGPSDPCDMERPVIAKLPYGMSGCNLISWWLVRQNQWPRAWIRNHIPQKTAGCYHLSMHLITDSGTQVLNYSGTSLKRPVALRVVLNARWSLTRGKKTLCQ